MNISRTRFLPDMRFSRGSQNWLVLYSEQVSCKSVHAIPRKSRKTTQKCTFLYFMDEPDFLWIIRLCHSGLLIEGLTSCKVSRKSVCGKYHNFLWPTNQLFFHYMPQLKLRNCNVLKHLASTLDFYHLSKFIHCTTCLTWMNFLSVEQWCPQNGLKTEIFFKFRLWPDNLANWAIWKLWKKIFFGRKIF